MLYRGLLKSFFNFGFDSFETFTELILVTVTSVSNLCVLLCNVTEVD